MWVLVCPDDSQPAGQCQQAEVWVEYPPAAQLSPEDLGELMGAIAVLMAIAFVFSYLRRRIWR